MTTATPQRVLLIGATGGTGRLAAAAAARHGLKVRALARNPQRARTILPDVEIVQGDLEDPASLTAAVQDVDAILFTHGSDSDGRPGSAQRIDYGGVANTLNALNGRRPRIALMTSINVTRSDNGAYQDLLDWKRRSERLVRLSGAPYTIVRPSWFNPGAGKHLVIKQGDTGSGAVRREDVAEVLIRSLLTDEAAGKTFELYATAGTPTSDWAGLFDTAVPDADGALDGAKDTGNLPLEKEPAPVREDVARFRA
ncbi:SDR family oxidoreductase [Pseudarthrobacter albicanus]|uniref:SDR family oxidoreductase n=1 Tax=Pseudarthrobacter albicanus TaxID=2823873 RepID=UPI001BAB0982|nr:SDR family oxidoreductase [Pseudarthrobacter albicanus]